MKEKHLALEAECERLARVEEAKMIEPGLTDAQRLAASENARVYRQLAHDWGKAARYAEEARPTRFTARNSRSQSKTGERKAFLASIADSIGTKKHAAIAATAVQSHSGMVLKLWRARGVSAESKILNFLRNHGV